MIAQKVRAQVALCGKGGAHILPATAGDPDSWKPPSESHTLYSLHHTAPNLLQSDCVSDILSALVLAFAPRLRNGVRGGKKPATGGVAVSRVAQREPMHGATEMGIDKRRAARGVLKRVAELGGSQPAAARRGGDGGCCSISAGHQL